MGLTKEKEERDEEQKNNCFDGYIADRGPTL